MERKTRADIARYREVRNLPTPVANGVYEMAVKAFENGCPNFEHPVVLRGLIVKPFKDGRQWKIKARGVEMFFRWFMNHIPTDVVEGKRYTIVGDLLTANQGKKFILDDCVIVPRHKAFMEKMDNTIHSSVLNINEYIEKPNKDTFFIKE